MNLHRNQVEVFVFKKKKNSRNWQLQATTIKKVPLILFELLRYGGCPSIWGQFGKHCWQKKPIFMIEVWNSKCSKKSKSHWCFTNGLKLKWIGVSFQNVMLNIKWIDKKMTALTRTKQITWKKTKQKRETASCSLSSIYHLKPCTAWLFVWGWSRWYGVESPQLSINARVTTYKDQYITINELQ